MQHRYVGSGATVNYIFLCIAGRLQDFYGRIAISVSATLQNINRDQDNRGKFPVRCKLQGPKRVDSVTRGSIVHAGAQLQSTDIDAVIPSMQVEFQTSGPPKPALEPYQVACKPNLTIAQTAQASSQP